MDNDKERIIPKKNNGEAVTEKSLSLKGDSLSFPPASPFSTMYRGYFPLWRKIVEWGWYKDSNTKALFLHLLLSTKYQEGDFLGYKLEVGQCAHGLIELSKNLGLSVSQVRTAIKHLKMTSEITTQLTNRFTIFTLVNYEKYTLTNNIFDTPHRKTIARQSQDNRKTIATYNKDNKDNKDNNREFAEQPQENQSLDTKSKLPSCQAYFYLRYMSTVGHNYVADFGKDGKLFKNISLAIKDDDKVKELIDKFFLSSDEFILKSGYSTGVFYSQINKLSKSEFTPKEQRIKQQNPKLPNDQVKEIAKYLKED